MVSKDQNNRITQPARDIGHLPRSPPLPTIADRTESVPSLLLRIEGARLYLPFISRYTLTSRTLLAPKTQNRLPFYRGDVHQILYGTTIQQDPKTETP